jgi:hypothetical protein
MIRRKISSSLLDYSWTINNKSDSYKSKEIGMIDIHVKETSETYSTSQGPVVAQDLIAL